MARDRIVHINMTTLVEKAPLFQEARWSLMLVAALVDVCESVKSDVVTLYKCDQIVL
jgi:hypothetical protein